MADTPNTRRTRTFRIGDIKIIDHSRWHARFADLYHIFLTLTWPRFFACLCFAFVSINFAFGLIYWLLPNSVANVREGVFIDHFFFSVETLATVGYGVFSPASLAGHIVASIEILFGMVGIALTTGLVFARFTKPTARIVFSQRAIIRQFDGQRMLMLRIANERYNRIVNASATLSLVRQEQTLEGEAYFRIYDLRLVRQNTQVFALTWTLMHAIDEHSPLYGLGEDEWASSSARILAFVTGHDETIAASVHAATEYDAEDVIFGGRFTDVLILTPGGARVVDLTRFHDVELTAESGMSGKVNPSAQSAPAPP